ncbi:hypothetical protein [Marinicella meishanensis]|uniref:hypothetical protein n=1 Tax=Marinicella meishanensis TaxID=2873263 RepID=UPI001CBB0846|nr:hypothetical protein [Marinicella sp. NBU2979]
MWQQQINQAWQWLQAGRLSAAHDLLRSLYEQAKPADDPPRLLSVIGKWAHVLLDMGQCQAAMDLYAEAIDLAQDQNDDAQLGYYLRHQADAMRIDDPEAALAVYHEALACLDSKAEPLAWANALRGRALSLEHTGQWQLAVADWQQALAVYAASGIAEGVSEATDKIKSLQAQRP